MIIHNTVMCSFKHKHQIKVLMNSHKRPINLLAPELFFLILAHSVYKM